MQQPAQQTRIAGLTHIGKMSQIISQLSRCGLPETQDDHYLMETLGDLVESIRRWARLFSQGQPPLDLKHAWIPARVRDYLKSGFLSTRFLLADVGEKLQTRLVEVIMLRTLMGDRLWRLPIGLLECKYYRDLTQMMDCTSKPHCSSYLLLYSCSNFFFPFLFFGGG